MTKVKAQAKKLLSEMKRIKIQPQMRNSER